MELLISSNGAISATPVAPPTSGTPGYPAPGVPGVSNPSIIEEWHYALIVDEIVNCILPAGITLDRTKRNQLYTALNVLFRPRILGNVTYYVATGGSDYNNGTSLSTPFATLQHAANVVAGLDAAGNEISIQLGAGTFAGALFNGGPTGLRSGAVMISGQPGGATTIAASDPGVGIGAANGAVLNVSNLTMNGGFELSAQPQSQIIVGAGMIFGPTADVHLNAAGGSVILTASYTVDGPAEAHMYASPGGLITLGATGVVATVTGNPNFSVAFLQAVAGQIVLWLGGSHMTFSGSATGQTYNFAMGGGLDSNGSSLGIPGNVSGTINASTSYAGFIRN